MNDDHDPVHVLSDEEAWEFLRAQQFGRLAYHVATEVDIVPINYLPTSEGLIFKTAPGSKLFGVTAGKTVAFEVDQVDADSATSVVARGVARHLTGDAADDADALPLHTWIPTEKQEYVTVQITEISGRRFDLSGPSTRASA